MPYHVTLLFGFLDDWKSHHKAACSIQMKKCNQQWQNGWTMLKVKSGGHAIYNFIPRWNKCVGRSSRLGNYIEDLSIFPLSFRILDIIFLINTHFSKIWETYLLIYLSMWEYIANLSKIYQHFPCQNTSFFKPVWPIFLATKAPISLSNVAQRTQLKFFNVAQRAQ